MHRKKERGGVVETATACLQSVSVSLRREQRVYRQDEQALDHVFSFFFVGGEMCTWRAE